MQSRSRFVFLGVLVVVILASAVFFLAPKDNSVSRNTNKVNPVPVPNKEQRISVSGVVVIDGDTFTVTSDDKTVHSCRKTATTVVKSLMDDKTISVGDVIHSWSKGTTTPSSVVVLRGITLPEYVSTLPQGADNINFNGEVVSTNEREKTVRASNGSLVTFNRGEIKNISVSIVSKPDSSGFAPKRARMECFKKQGSSIFEATLVALFE